MNISLLTLIVAGVVMLLGSNLIGGMISKIWRSREMELQIASIEKCLDRWSTELAGEKIVSASHSVSIAVIQTAILNIQTAQKEIKEILNEMRKTK